MSPKQATHERRRALTPIAHAERRRRRREWGIAAFVAALLGSLFVFEGVVLGRSRSLPIGSDAVFFALVHLNVIGIGLLAWLLSRNVIKLVIDRRRGLIGSKLNSKFVVSFVFTAAVATTGLFILSGFLVSHTVDTWFELELSEGLQRALQIGEVYYDEAEDRLCDENERLAAEIAAGDLLRPGFRDDLDALLRRARIESSLGAIEVFDGRGGELAAVTAPDATLVAFEGPSSTLLRAGLAGQERAERSNVAGGVLLRSITPIFADTGLARAGSPLDSAPPVVVIGAVISQRILPGSVAGHASAVEAALEAYRRLQPSGGPFRGSMLLLLGMLTLVSLLFSSWMGFRLAKQITDPLQRLAFATAELASGNLDVRVEQRGEDEIGHLVAAFNRMATDLKASREDLERRRTLMEIILGGVGVGVISLDAEGLVTTINASARRLLGVSSGDWRGVKPNEILRGEALDALESLLARLAGDRAERVRCQLPISVDGQHLILNWTVSRLQDAAGENFGLVILIDDLTQIVKGQRTAAWRDVARRIAHEIKNPLTPIQLSAQRLRRKLGPRTQGDADRRVLEECTDAIVAQVDAMKVLLNEFSNFAALPATEPVPTNLNDLVTEAIAMYKGKPSIEFRAELAQDLPELDVDREQIKRVILNLVDNAMGAIEAAGPGPRQIVVATRVDHALGTVQLEVSDTGCGVRPEHRAQLFQPGFSTKENGTGIGLAIVSRIVSDHSGYVRVRSHSPRGTSFVIELPARL